MPALQFMDVFYERPRCIFCAKPSFCGAGHRIPAGCVGLFLELGTPDEGLSEVFGIFEHQSIDQIRGTSVAHDREIFHQDSVFTKRHPIFVDVTGTHLRRGDFQSPGAGLRALTSTAAAASR